MKTYGKELILDIGNCDSSTFNRKSLTDFLVELCDNVIDMEREPLYFWDFEGDPEGYEEAPDHLKGISCVQFISTSNIVIHTVDVMRNIHLNIFSCKDFEEHLVVDFTVKWFKGEVMHIKAFPRFKEPNIEIRKMNGFYFLWINDHLWMYDILPERKAQQLLANQAYGNVLCVGYGLGLVQKYLLQNPNVTSVTSVEKYKKVVDLNKVILGEIFGDIIIEDFFNYNPLKGEYYDCIIGDICDDIMPEYLSDYMVFKAKARTILKMNGKLLQWGGDYFESLLKRL